MLTCPHLALADEDDVYSTTAPQVPTSEILV